MRDGMSVDVARLIPGVRTLNVLTSTEEVRDGNGVVPVPCWVEDAVAVWFAILVDCKTALVLLIPGSETEPVGPAVDVKFDTGKWVENGNGTVSDMLRVELG